LSKIEIGTGVVAHGHGPAKLALRPEAVDDNAVDGDDQGLDYDLDDAADKSPVLGALLVLFFAPKDEIVLT
jgi:hypothetical protein